jgi:hypothetical protein
VVAQGVGDNGRWHFQNVLANGGCAARAGRNAEQEADAWLASIGPELDGLRAAIADDDALRDLLRTPLALSIAAMTYRGTDVATPTGLDGLFAAYTQRMLDYPRAVLADGGYTHADARRGCPR